MAEINHNLHIPIIVALRGFAATSVCFYHFVCTTTGFIQNKSVTDIFSYGQYGVSLFFIISGIVIPISLLKANYKLPDFPKFILKRFVRIEPPYIVAIGVGIVYLVVRNYIPGTAQVDLTPSILNVLLHFCYLIPFFEDQNWINPVFWTLAIEFQYYIYLSFLFPLLTSDKFVKRLLFYMLFLLPSVIFPDRTLFPAWSAYFLIGIVYSLVIYSRIHRLEFFLVLSCSFSIAFCYLGPINLIIAVLSLLTIHFLRELKSKPTNFLGNISYSLYLLHSIIGAAFVNYFSHRVSESWEKTVIILCGFLVSVIASYVMYKLIEVPSQKLARKFYN